ncbi:HEPN domain-containing protein [Mucilaginibacter pineti]|uniref:HEPN domain-containing protein n=1 Tax=Mucilaginibacter pineti TaxID=1391627 RepID=A0A1G7P627_9SPHI|nr:HEPN domain-containing protein [Mucilaginibacter pineti]SDF81049.1 HEPN domain-containing protein [Mucilaginibacter pineti]
MNTSLTHLPEAKQKELAEILEVIKQEAKPVKIILYGSHARGDWVEDIYVEHRAVFSYISDYDFLVVIKKNGEKEYEIISKIVNRTKKYKNSVRPIVHDIDYVNYGLERGQYIFSDIIAEGVLLYDTNEYEFVKARPLTREEQKEDAEHYYNEWCESGIRLFEHTKSSFDLAIKKGFVLNEVVFFLHQTVEKFYAGIALVFKGYKPKTHSIEDFRTYTKYISEELYKVFCFPPDNKEEARLFDILQKSYIDARYKPNYKISKEDLEQLIKRVGNLEAIVVKLCNERIKSLS